MHPVPMTPDGRGTTGNEVHDRCDIAPLAGGLTSKEGPLWALLLYNHSSTGQYLALASSRKALAGLVAWGKVAHSSMGRSFIESL